MFSKTKAKRLALGLALVLALAAAPQALAAPGVDSDLGGAVYGWLADLWQSVRSVVVTHDDMGGGTLPNAEPANFGSVATPNGLSSESGDEIGPWAIPDGDRVSADSEEEEYGPYVIPSGGRTPLSNSEDDEMGGGVIPNG